MIKRPTKKDSENDVLQMQHDYFKEQKKNASFEPAAKFVRIKREGDPNSEPKQSEFAKRRNLRKATEETVQKPLDNTVIGDIVEKVYNADHPMSINTNRDRTDSGFPKVGTISIQTTAQQEQFKNKSLFAQMVSKKKDDSSTSASIKITETSKILEQSDEAMQIHEENIEKISQMSQEEIQRERDNIMQTMDPKLLDFLKFRKTVQKPETTKVEPEKMESIPEAKLDLEILKEQGANNWLHFDVLEPEKLEWTKNVQASLKNLKPGEKFEARFDWKGVLLPYVDKNTDKDERELYLHGEEADRPGYTLQELFRLARSNVLQQRISALNSIAGILNIFSQGFYDGVLELPISKIFFFLRFALDENTPAIVDGAARSLAFLFYNDTDEKMMDTIFETNLGIFQPEMDLNVLPRGENQNNLENKFSNMNLNQNTKKQVRFESQVDNDEDEMNPENMNDFHMAETDLMEALLRTNILERIRYILFTIRPESSTVMSCVKILIRMARNNEEFALKIIQNEFLIQNLMKFYLTSIDGYGEIEPQYIILKLIRVLCAQNATFYKQYLEKLNILEYLKRYVFTRKDINVKMIQIQIETFRLLRIILTFSNDAAIYRELLPALTYLLEWHYQHLIYDDTGPFLIRQHCAALLSLIGCNPQQMINQQVMDKFFACASKWFTFATKHGANEFSQKILLTSCLNLAKNCEEKLPGENHNFYENYFLPFLSSEKFSDLTNCLSLSALFKHDYQDCSQRISPLSNLGGIMIKENHSGEPTLIITKSYPMFLLYSMLQFVKGSETRLSNSILHNKFIEKYLRKLASINLAESKLTTNWYLKTELRFILSILKILKCENVELCLKIALNILPCLSEEFYPDIILLFDEIVFNLKFYRKNDFACRAEDLQRWKFMFKLKLVDGESRGTFKGFTVDSSWRNKVLKKSWPYSLTYAILDKLEKGTAKLEKFTEEEIIKTTAMFTELLETNGVESVTPTEKLMYLMTLFLGPDSKFLDPLIASLLKRRVKALNLEMNGKLFDFDSKLDNGKSFQGLYQLVLDIFQSSSYGNSLFGSLVMVPLAQHYDVKWRNMVWSEYVAVLRFITCQECELFNPLDNYLNPGETDGSLIKLYALALNSNLLRPQSIPHRIAQHHLNKRRQMKS